MKDRLREMRQWWNEVLKEDEKDSHSADDDHLPKVLNITQEESEVSQVVSETEGGACEAAVCVERNGECLILHFKCPCGKSFQILAKRKKFLFHIDCFMN